MFIPGIKDLPCHRSMSQGDPAKVQREVRVTSQRPLQHDLSKSDEQAYH